MSIILSMKKSSKPYKKQIIFEKKMNYCYQFVNESFKTVKIFTNKSRPSEHFFYLIFPSKSIIWVKVEDYTQSWFGCYTFPPYLLWFSRLCVYPVTFFTFFVLLVVATGVLINCFEMHRCSGWIEKWRCRKMHFPLEKALLNYRYTSGKNIHVHH